MSYNRILLKISGEALMGEKDFGHDINVIEMICCQVKEAYEAGKEICLVIGGGNILRGASFAGKGFERASADYMGMLATVINSLAIQNFLEASGVQTRVLSAIPMTTVCESYIKRRASRHMEKGRVVIFAAGTGNPFFTTDMAAALRATEMGCDVLLKGTQVDGIYSADPKCDKDAQRYDRLSYKDVIEQGLNVMDASAITLAREHKIPIIVFSIREEHALSRVLAGEGKFTIVS